MSYNIVLHIKDKVMKMLELTVVLAAFLVLSCEMVNNDAGGFPGDEEEVVSVRLDEVAEILAMVPFEVAQMGEVHDAVLSSSGNGYDEEYMMKSLFSSPGSGVGDDVVKSVKTYDMPLWKMIEEQVRSMPATKSLSMDPDRFLSALTESDVQIYWPFSDKWDGETMPVITFDPEDGASTNIGYRLKIEDDGSRHVEDVVVDEDMAEEVPVWVINRNDDAGYTSLEMLRREDPDWGEGGGTIIINPTKSTLRSLVLKSFTMKRNYDSWFAGASEFFVKIGYIGDFTATTEAELKLYDPEVTDFMVVVKRNQVGIPQDFNVMLMSDWYEESDACAFMITEDDGGTKTEWTSKAKVFVAGKSYGVEITLPLNVRDDIVWRGKLSYDWFEKCNGQSWPFGDVDLAFEIVEH